MTLANQLTLLRIGLVPGLVILVVYGHFRWAIVVFFVAGVTDGLDGLAARVRGERTALGSMLDPLADKLLVTALLLALAMPNRAVVVPIPAWLAIVSIGRDALILLASLVFHLALGTRMFYPSALGKATTVAHLGLILWILWRNEVGADHPATPYLLGITVSLVAASGVHYLLMGHRMVSEATLSNGEAEDPSDP